MRSNKIKVFYNPKQVLENEEARNFSKSPLKPKLLLEYLNYHGLFDDNFELVSNFRPFSNNELCIAHSREYVESFFSGGNKAESNSLRWSPQFANSVRYTNASLYEAVRNSLVNPSEVSFSPTSGFHHATPYSGRGFCTFSGQVLASVKLWRTHGAVGCYLDLDGHHGNSIDDSRDYQPDLNKAVPVGFNFNPHSYEQKYFNSLVKFLTMKLKPAIVMGKIDYVVWCHGADSHEHDDLGHQVSTEFWVKCATYFWKWVKEMDQLLGRPLPVSCALFGGYRSDDYNSVLSLHTMDFVQCLRNLLNKPIAYTHEVKERAKYVPEPMYYNDRTPQSQLKLPPPNRYVCSTDMGARRKRLDEADRIMREQRDRMAENESEFERFYRLRINGRNYITEE